MTIRNPPLYLQGRADHTAANDRLGKAAMLMPASGAIPSIMARGGVRPTSSTLLSLLVSAQATPDNSVAINAGVAFVAGTSNPGTQGVYTVFNDSTITLNLTPAHATLPRRDLIILRVYDNESDGSGLNLAQFEHVTGAANASPTLPATPVNSLVLAELLFQPATVARPQDLTDRRTWTVPNGAPVPYRSGARPAQAYAGQLGYDIDTSSWEGSSAAGWRRLLNDPDNDTGTWVPYTPTLTAGGTTVNVGSTGRKVGRRKLIGKTVFAEFEILWNGTGLASGAGLYVIGLPFNTAAEWEGSAPVGQCWIYNGNGNYIRGTIPGGAGTGGLNIWVTASPTSSVHLNFNASSWATYTSAVLGAGGYITGSLMYEIDL